MARKLVVAAAAVLIVGSLLGGCAKKTPGYASVDEVFAVYDTNRDGVITKEEFTATWQDKEKADQAWKRIDPKGNGFVNRMMANDMPLDVWHAVETDTIH